MSLRGRLFALILLINLGMLGAIQVSTFFIQRRWVDPYVENLIRNVYQSVIERAYSPEQRDPLKSVRAVLSPDSRETFKRRFRDVVIRNAPTPGLPSVVDLNPIGAAHRDVATFSIEAIHEGIAQAMASGEIVEVGGGYCVAIARGADVVGGAWLEPREPPPLVPLSLFVLPLAAGTVLLGLALYWSLGRGLERPLARLSEASRQVGAGEYDVRVPRVGVPELAAFVEAFNTMAERVEDQHLILEREVQRATDEAKRKERALLMSSRLATMGTLAAGIAHEINNPIGGMINAVRRIETNDTLTDRDRRYVELIREGLERVGNIARRVLDFSPKQLEPVPFSLQSAVDGARALVDHRLRQGDVTFECALSPDLPNLVGDRHELQQVFLNLFINSLDVLAERDGVGGRIEVRARPVAAGVEIVVEDDGPGMPTADLSRVFDPFFSAKGRPDASGLGMFIGYSIVRNHGGDMELDSAPGAGFRVRMTLPVEGGDADAS